MLAAAVFVLASCEDVIDLKVEDGVPQLVIDAWLTDKPEDQVVKLTISQPYFDNTAPKPALDATVIVFEADSTAHVFSDLTKTGTYVLPSAEAGFLKEGGRYALYVKYQDEEYYAVSALRRVPVLDSLVYEHFELPVTPTDGSPKKGFLAQFYGKDPVGEGDTYWIKTIKNNKLMNNPAQISLAFDAGFSPGSKSDGLTFILPIRQSINDGLYLHGDTVKVELWSVGQDAYYYLLQVRQESGNGGIFATPPANIPTNIFNLNTDSDKKPLGFFGISAISTISAVIDSTKAKPKQ